MCWRDGESRLVRAVVLPKRACGPAPGGLPCAALRWDIAVRPGPACLWRQAGCRVREARSGDLGATGCGRMSLAVRVFAPTQARARAKITRR